MIPKISVIVPVYNVVKFLDKCILSVLNQTFKEFELILVNDGSTDGSKEICNYYRERDNRVKVVHKYNTGVSDTRNIGLDISTGGYVCFIDSDDYINSNMFEDLYRHTEDGKIDIIVSGMYFERNDDGSWENKIKYCEANNLQQIKNLIVNLFKSYLLYNPVGKLYKKEIIDKYNIKFKKGMSFGEDPVFNCEFMKHIYSIKNIDKCYYNYVKHGEISLSIKYDETKYESNKKMHNELANLMKYYQILDEEILLILRQRYKKELCDMLFTVGRANEYVHDNDKLKFLNTIFKDKEYEFLEEYLDGVNVVLVNMIKFKMSLSLVMYFKISQKVKKRG